MRKINLNKLESLPGITRKVGQFYYEATVYALKTCGHENRVQVKIFGAIEEKIELYWTEELEEDVSKSWKDEGELIEYGATGIALVLLLSLTNFTCVQRSPKGTRADYWVGKINKEGEEEYMGLLEISGMKKETINNRINVRLNQRIKRMEQSTYRNIPFFVFIVEFESPKVKFYKNER